MSVRDDGYYDPMAALAQLVEAIRWRNNDHNDGEGLTPDEIEAFERAEAVLFGERKESDDTQTDDKKTV